MEIQAKAVSEEWIYEIADSERENVKANISNQFPELESKLIYLGKQFGMS